MIILQLICVILISVVLALIVNAFDEYHKDHAVILDEFPIELNPQFGVPVLKGMQGDKEFWFMLDTGANTSALNQAALSQFQTKNLHLEGNVFGIDGNTINTTIVEAYFNIRKDVSIKETFQILDLNSALTQSSQLFGKPIIGILGSNFMKRYNLSIDLVNQKLCIYNK